MRFLMGTAYATVVLLCCAATFLAADKTAEPERGWVTDATVVSVYDGDTCTVEVRKFIKIRLEDCWAPEMREDGGPESGDHLRELIEGKKVLLRVGGSEDVWRKRTFGRDVGRIWLDGEDVTTLMVKSGHAYETKEALQESQK